MNLRQIWNLLRTTFQEWSEDKASRMAAALAYYTIFSLPPLLILIIGIVGLFVTRASVESALVEQFGSLLGQEGAGQIREIIANAAGPGGGLLATIIGVVTLLLGASGLFGQLQDSLNTIWDVRPRAGRSILDTIKSRFLSFSMVIGTAFLLLVSLALNAALAAFGETLGELLGVGPAVLQVVNLGVSLAIITLVFALVFRVLPDVQMAWRDALAGGAFTALLFLIGEYALGLYLGGSAVGSAFGAAGSLALLLVWIYYSAQILLLGAEFTQVYARMNGRPAVPKPNAEWLSAEQRIRQGMAAEKGGERRGAPGERREASPQPTVQPAPMRGLPARRPAVANGTQRRAAVLSLLALVTGVTFFLRRRREAAV